MGGESATCQGHYCRLITRTCFIAGTRILLANGKEVPIETIKAGDFVQGSTGVNKVIKPLTHEHESGVFYGFNGGAAFVTENHPFMTTEGWKSIDPKITKKEIPELKVGQLKVGDVLITHDGTITIKSIDKKETRIHTVYNMTLDKEHDYYADGYLVHNKTPVAPE